MLAANQDIGVDTGTGNPLVLECNDGYLNDVRGLHVKEDHVAMAIAAATGMSCYGLKGGIGSASRRFALDGRDRHLGSLVLTNMGRLDDLCPAGRAVARPPLPPGRSGHSPNRQHALRRLGRDRPGFLNRTAHPALSQGGSHGAAGDPRGYTRSPLPRAHRECRGGDPELHTSPSVIKSFW